MGHRGKTETVLVEAEEGADLCSPEGSWFHDPLPLSKGPELPAQLTGRLSENCPLSALTPTQSELSPLCISCPLLITPNPLQDSQPTSHPLDCFFFFFMWDLPGPGLEPVSPALAGGFLTTAPPGKPPPTRLHPPSPHYQSPT